MGESNMTDPLKQLEGKFPTLEPERQEKLVEWLSDIALRLEREEAEKTA